jgi:alcohol dehydrogenase class IV
MDATPARRPQTQAVISENRMTGEISMLPSLIAPYGKKVLFVTGARSFESLPHIHSILEKFSNASVAIEFYKIPHEPTPALIDEAVRNFTTFAPDTIVAIGGGSVLDAGKAISAMLPVSEPVKNFLEGVGSKAHPGKKIPFLAVPTTAGTGSEATKNAVLSEVGDHGFKRSLRHDNFVPNIALIDPSLTSTCPPSITASSGMDAFTQLLESYVSTNANPITDALALHGLQKIAHSLLNVYHDGGNLSARSDMALAAYLSGLTLANAGLGLVHGFASSVGGLYEIPHGVVCSSLMFACNKLTVDKLRKENNIAALMKYATVGKIFNSHTDKPDAYYIDALIDLLANYIQQMNIPRLSIPVSAFAGIVALTDNKNNPAVLNHDEMLQILSMVSK